jgi:prevent-host-death family protein
MMPSERHREGRMSTATVEDVRTHLTELLDRVAAGEDVVIVREGRPVARLVAEVPKGVPVIGRGKGKLIEWIDDDEHLKDFAEYMP